MLSRFFDRVQCNNSRKSHEHLTRNFIYPFHSKFCRNQNVRHISLFFAYKIPLERKNYSLKYAIRGREKKSLISKTFNLTLKKENIFKNIKRYKLRGLVAFMRFYSSYSSSFPRPRYITRFASFFPSLTREAREKRKKKKTNKNIIFQDNHGIQGSNKERGGKNITGWDKGTRWHIETRSFYA